MAKEEQFAKRVAIIGAGASGLTATKCCLEENIEPVCYEKSDYIGGLWRYRDEDVDGLPSVMKSTIINTNKELNAFSDFPPPKEFPIFMHNSLMFRYLEMYAEKFNLLAYMKFHHEILSVVPNDDYEVTGRWLVTVRNTREESVQQELFDGVMVCTGHHVAPLVPSFPGQDEFQGVVMHSHSYKKANGFEDKRVVVVGVGNSGSDIAVELSFVCKQVYICSRRGCWVIQRIGDKGLPFDAKFIRRYYDVGMKFMPLPIASSLVEREANHHFDHELYNLKPQHHFLNQHPTINDSLPTRIASGTVQVKPNIKRFTKNGVIFENDEIVEADVVILATGYKISIPFLSKEIFSSTENKVNLFKLMFPPDLKHHTLAIIGMVQLIGSLFPISEAQSRLFALVLRNKVHLPSAKKMAEEAEQRNRNNSRRYYLSPRHTIQADWFTYMDELGELSGTRPNLLKMAFTDPRLFFHCFFGPPCAYQYRLTGPHQWAGAKQAILTVNERFKAPLRGGRQ